MSRWQAWRSPWEVVGLRLPHSCEAQSRAQGVGVRGTLPPRSSAMSHTAIRPLLSPCTVQPPCAAEAGTDL